MSEVKFGEINSCSREKMFDRTQDVCGGKIMPYGQVVVSCTF